MLGRLFCFNGGGAADWAAQGHYADMARARVLGLVEEELEERYLALGNHAPAPRISQDATYLQRLAKANLPPSELSLCKELLRKLTAIDGVRKAAEAEKQHLQAQLKAAEGAHRQAEFARARAEAIATARGEALMHAQQATRDAEVQQVQLAEMLRQALPQLGIDISPLMHAQSPLLPAPGDNAVTPEPHQSGMFSRQQLAAVAASISKLPRQSQAGLSALDSLPAEGHQHGFATPVAQADQQQQREGPGAQRGSRRGSLAQEQRGRSRPGGGSGEEEEERAPLPGFTVYTNSLQQEGGQERRAGDVNGVQPVARPHSVPASPARQQQSQGSGVAWRSISSAALSSRSGGSAAEEGAGLERQRQQRDRTQGAQPRQLPSQRCSAENAAPQPAIGQDWQVQGSKLQQRGQHLPRLVLPGTHASQLDSLVRIGASMQSPDPHATAAAQRQPGVGLMGGQARPAADGRPAELEPAAQERGMLPAEQAWQQLPAAAALHQLYAEGSKFPGAGTWVSPSLAAMIAHKKGHNPFLEDGEPSPPSHIKAVFGTTADREFYGPMAAHLKQQERPADAQPAQGAPQALSARVHRSNDSVRGPHRPAPSTRSSLEGLAEASPRAQPQQQPALQPQPPEQRHVAFMNRFQPMGAYVQQSGEPGPPRHSSIAVSQLGAGTQQQQAAAAGAQPPTKRSLDSMRASIGGGAAVSGIQTSLLDVDRALQALREANPHLRDSHAASQQQQQARQGGQHHHARARSLPDTNLDLPLHAMGGSGEQRHGQRLAPQQTQQRDLHPAARY